MEVTPHSLVFAVSDVSHAGEVRRAAVSLASRLGLDEQTQGKIAIVAAELVKNLVAHAKDAQCVIQAVATGEFFAIDLLALDKGPGMANVSRALQDGHSTAGTAGIGLGAIRRLSSTFDIFSAPGYGTVVFSRIWQQGIKGASPCRWDEGAVSLAMTGESVCGDSWGTEHRSGRSVIIVADGLGHGPMAAEASSEAVRLFRANADRGPEEIIQAIHAGLRATRGVAVAVAECNWSSRQITFAGLGNIAAAIISGSEVKNLTSFNGIAGHELRRLSRFVYPLPAGAVLIMHSDGLATQWRLDKYPGLYSRHPATMAGVLYRDFTRGRDDVTVVAVRESTAEGAAG